MGCFGCNRRTFKRLDSDQYNTTENNNYIGRKIRRRSLKALYDKDINYKKDIDHNIIDNSNNNIIGRSNTNQRSRDRSRSLKRLDANQLNNNNIIGGSRNTSRRSASIRQEDHTQRYPVTLKVISGIARKEKDENLSNYLLSPKSKDSNLKYKLRTGSSRSRFHVAAEEKGENLLIDLLKENRMTNGQSKTGSDVTADESSESSSDDLLSQKLKDDILSQDFKDSDFKDNGKKNGKEARAFKYNDLAKATGNFRSSCFLGEGGFGKVYKGHLEKINQEVAIKQLDRTGGQGIREFVMEVLTLSLADHPNLVKLLGFCVDGDKRLLVYEYMPLGSLERYLHDLTPEQKPLDWNTRMKIAAGAARGLEYLHDEIKPPVIYRDLKCSNILLGEGYHPKLSDFGLAKIGPSGNKTHVSTRVMGTYGYCAPDYAMTGQLNFKSDIYSFGVVLLELITGRKAFDHSKTGKEQSLVAWARPHFKDRKKFTQMADPLLEGKYPIRSLYQALAISAMCIQEKANMRPAISDVVNALNFLASQKYSPGSSVTKHSRSSTYSSGDKDCESSYFSLEEKSSDDDDDNGQRKTNILKNECYV